MPIRRIEISLGERIALNLSGEGIDDSELLINMNEAEYSIIKKIIERAKKDSEAEKFIGTLFSVENLFGRLWNKGDNEIPWEVIWAMSELDLLPAPLDNNNLKDEKTDSLFEICKWNFPSDSPEWVKENIPSLFKSLEDGVSVWRFRAVDIVAGFLGFGVKNFKFEVAPKTEFVKLF